MPGVAGSGGLPNFLPGRGFPEYGNDYNRDAAERHWERLFALFRRRLTAGK